MCSQLDEVSALLHQHLPKHSFGASLSPYIMGSPNDWNKSGNPYYNKGGSVNGFGGNNIFGHGDHFGSMIGQWSGVVDSGRAFEEIQPRI